MWTTSNKELKECPLDQIKGLLDLGFVPVIHGDAVIDTIQGCAILSGDVIMKYLCQELKPVYCTFLTDVEGVYDKPPSEGGSILMEILVDKQGNINFPKTVSAQHDVTGGMKAKIENAIEIAQMGIDIFIAKAGTEGARMTCSGRRAECTGTHIHKV